MSVLDRAGKRHGLPKFLHANVGDPGLAEVRLLQLLVR